MNRLAIRGAFLLALIGPAAPLFSADEPADPQQRQIEAAIEKVKPALVRIHVVEAYFAEGREQKQESVGSGAIVTPEGHVVTNHHVAGHAVRLAVTLSTREEVEAELIGKDPLTDLAVIKLKGAEGRKFPTVEFGDSAALAVGDRVLAMGSPLAISQSVTLGIVSNTEMVMPRFYGPFAKIEMDGEDVGGLVRWIAHDAAIYGGNSGGPLVDLEGRIVGINEISFGLSGAIPGDIAKGVVRELIDHGKVRRGWIGVSVQPRLKDSPKDAGVLVASVLKGSPAEKAGLKPGDLLLKLGEKPINVQYDEEIPELNLAVSALAVGAGIPAVVWRDGNEVALKLEPAEREDARPEQKEFAPWGITARNLSLILAKELKRETTDGVLVTTIRPGGPADEAKPSIGPGAVLVSVDGEPVKNLASLAEITAKIIEGKTERTPVLAAYEVKAERFVTIVKLGLAEMEDPGTEVKKAWLPIQTQVISRDIADKLKQPDLRGFRVTLVHRGSSAEKAGLKVGDFITAVDGTALEASAPEDYEELEALIRQYKVGTTAELSILREGKDEKIAVELTRAPLLPRELKKYRNEDFGFTVRDVAFIDRAEERWHEEQQGVLVEEVRPGSWANLGQLQFGDLIMKVGGEQIAGIDSLRAAMDKIAEARPERVVMVVLRGIHTAFIEIETRWPAK